MKIAILAPHLGLDDKNMDIRRKKAILSVSEFSWLSEFSWNQWFPVEGTGKINSPAHSTFQSTVKPHDPILYC